MDYYNELKLEYIRVVAENDTLKKEKILLLEYIKKVDEFIVSVKELIKKI